jgi:endonuclease G
MANTLARIVDDRIAETREARANTRKLVASRSWAEAEPDRARLHAFEARRVQTKGRGAEAIQGENDLLPVSYLVEGSNVRRAVGFVEVNDPRQSTVGSGFLISPRLFLTNSHVIRDEQAASCTQVTFDREFGAAGRFASPSTYRLRPDEFALFSPEGRLDYALVAIGERTSGEAVPEELGYCPLFDTPDRHIVGMNVNIIQHPTGLPKMVAIRNNVLTWRTDRTLLYDTDTDVGASGAPVFNDFWEVVALHHYGHPFLELVDENGHEIPINVNEGVRISAIVKDLVSRRDGLSRVQQQLLVEALVAGKGKQDAVAKRLGPPRPRASAEAMVQVYNSEAMDMREQAAATIVIPLEISIRLGSGGNGASMGPSLSTPQEALREGKTLLRRGAEAIRIDTDYSNRGGFAPDFIPGFPVPLPGLSPALTRQVAPLRAGEPDAASGELKYQHFSIKMHKGRRLAIFTATNIDGEAYLAIDRKTGLPSEGAEGERWFKDPRISESFVTGQDFYSEWSIYFDRGHLTRRIDPTWGTVDEAVRANADTYHFTNCSPQHFRFNQSTKYWQGAEKYIIEHGVLSAVSRRRVCVIQGPLYDDNVDQYAGELQIPSSFFKVIAWVSDAGPKSVGLVVDQLPLLGEQRVNLGQPKPTQSADVSQWRVPISQIARKAGVEFDAALVAADTIGAAAQPVVGAEAALPLRSFEDLLR